VRVPSRLHRRGTRPGTAALGAGHGVEHLLPRQVTCASRAEANLSFWFLEIDRLQPAARMGAAEVDVDRRHHDVEVLGVRQVHEEREDDHHVRPHRGALETGEERPDSRGAIAPETGAQPRRVVVYPSANLRGVPHKSVITMPRSGPG